MYTKPKPVIFTSSPSKDNEEGSETTTDGPALNLTPSKSSSPEQFSSLEATQVFCRIYVYFLGSIEDQSFVSKFL